jgi:hypothetical protein
MFVKIEKFQQFLFVLSADIPLLCLVIYFFFATTISITQEILLSNISEGFG